MSGSKEVLRAIEAIPCEDCPVKRACAAFKEKFYSPYELAELDDQVTEDLKYSDVVEEFNEKVNEDFARGKWQDSPEGLETFENRKRWKFLNKLLTEKDFFSAWVMIHDEEAEYSNAGCKGPRKRFKFFGKQMCGGMVYRANESEMPLRYRETLDDL